MKTRMTHAARAELVDAVQSRYSAASGMAKRRILDEFIAASGYHEKSAIRVLNRARPVPVRQTRKRPSLYDDASRAALMVLWQASVGCAACARILPTTWRASRAAPTPTNPPRAADGAFALAKASARNTVALIW